MRAYNADYLKNLNDVVASTHIPIIGAVNGYAVRTSPLETIFLLNDFATVWPCDS